MRRPQRTTPGLKRRGGKMVIAQVVERTERERMAVEKDLISPRNDDNFRKGACHAAQWLADTAKALTNEGYSAAEISGRLSVLAGVLDDWRSQVHPMPDGNPWDWSFKDLASVIDGEKDS